jgi:hypothetical protein
LFFAFADGLRISKLSCSETCHSNFKSQHSLIQRKVLENKDFSLFIGYIQHL